MKLSENDTNALQMLTVLTVLIKAEALVRSFDLIYEKTITQKVACLIVWCISTNGTKTNIMSTVSCSMQSECLIFFFFFYKAEG